MVALVVSVLLDGTAAKTCGTSTGRSSPELYGQSYVLDCENTHGNAVKLFYPADTVYFMTVSEVVLYRAGIDFYYCTLQGRY